MNKNSSINALVELGLFLDDPEQLPTITEWAHRAHAKNPWFTVASVLSALKSIAKQMLAEEKLRPWAQKYGSASGAAPKKIGVVAAGNIPAVCFQDMLCVLVSQHDLILKMSSDDSVLVNFLLQKLVEIEPEMAQRIEIAERLNAADAYIATGSDNTARYFEYYFAKKPHIIRKNRTSVGIVSGQETADELLLLGGDVLQYFGLGCRNVSKLFVPKDYNFVPFYDAIEPMSAVYANHYKYFNNYEYNKSVYLVNRQPHYDNNFLITTQSQNLVSPISVLFYDTYETLEELNAKIEVHADKIQCTTSRAGWYAGSIPFGTAQEPSLTDYPDGIDTMAFLEAL